jgi:SAM-dependent methyltransferase
LRQIHRSLKPGGFLIVTTPALRRFWTWNDELVHHVRRYDKADYRRLACVSGFTLLDARYFMFLLSPLMLAARIMRRPDVERLTESQRQELLAATHRVPAAPLNAALAAVFAAETPLGHWAPFPWGTSILAVMRRDPEPSAA